MIEFDLPPALEFDGEMVEVLMPAAVASALQIGLRARGMYLFQVVDSRAGFSMFGVGFSFALNDSTG